MLVYSINVKTNRTPKERGKRLIRTIKKGTEWDKCSIVLHINYKKPHSWAHCPQLLVLWSLSKDSSVLPTLTESSLISSHIFIMFVQNWNTLISFLAAEFESHFTFKWRDQKTESCFKAAGDVSQWRTHLPLCCCFHTCFFTLVLKLKSSRG